MSECRESLTAYYPHRFRAETGFDNPSVYCADYVKLIRHVRAAVEAEAGSLPVAAAPAGGGP